MGHFYDTTGLPCYTVPNISKGGERNTTVTDARKLGLVPSVTELFNLLAKDGIIRWQEDHMLSATWEMMFEDHKDFDDYKRNIRTKVKDRTDVAPRIGSEIHNELEQWYKAGGNTPPGDRIQHAVFAVREQVGKSDYVAEETFYHPLGFGGTVDLHCKNINIVLDFKTKDTKKINTIKKVKSIPEYEEYLMQLAAYRHGLGIESASCYNLFISREDPSIVKCFKHDEEELQRAWEMFKCLLRFWQLSNKFEVGIT